MKKQSKSYVITFRMNEEEYTLFERKFQNSKLKTKGGFIRRMIFKGWLIIPDDMIFESMKKCLQLLQNTSSSINQIAVRANSTGAVYKEDSEEVKRNLEAARKECKEIWQQLKSIQSLLR